jgi:hypothetical protein
MFAPAWSRSQLAASASLITLPPCGVDSEIWSNNTASMPAKLGEATICSKRLSTLAISASLIERSATAEGLGDASAVRALGLGTTDAVLTGVGMGVLMLRVSVAAAPGTGVASGPSSVEQPDSRAARTTPQSALAQIVAQLLGPTGVAQLTKRLGFDLADPLASDAEFTTDFLQRTLASIVQPEA